MGDTVRTQIHLDGKAYAGQALLETSELIVRGERRVVIPFGAITSVDVRDGVLVVVSGEGEIAIELGAQAAKWAAKIRNPKTVVQKLGIKPGQQVSLAGIDDDAFVRDLEKAGALVAARVKKNSDAIFFGANRRADLARLAALRDSLAQNGALWIIRPKGVKEITEADVMAAGKAAGLVDVKVVRFSGTHTAEKLVIPVARRAR